MTKIKKILRCKKALSYPLIIALVLAIIIISCAVFEYMRLMIIAQGVRDGVQSAVISVSTDNYSGVYASVREGYSGGYVNDGSGWSEQIKTGDVYARLVELLGLRKEGSHYVKYVDGDVIEYSISNLTVNVINAPLAPADRDSAQKFLSEATIYLEVPLSFGWSSLPSMKITLHCKAGWTPKF